MREDFSEHEMKKRGGANSRRQFLRWGIGAAAVVGVAGVAGVPGVADGTALPPFSGQATRGTSTRPLGPGAENQKISGASSETSTDRIMRILRRYGSELGEVDDVRIRG